MHCTDVGKKYQSAYVNTNILHEMFIKKKHDIHDQVIKYNFFFIVTLNKISFCHLGGLTWTCA